MSTTATHPAAPVTDIELAIGGMTCASCANRIERKLNKLDGVTATVNYATEKAKINAPDGIDPAELLAQVEAAGYTATLPRTAEPDDADAVEGEPDPTRTLRERLVTSVI
ncbi:MAG: cation transporter, partial [Pseudonocardia sp.]